MSLLILFGAWDILQYWRKKHTSTISQGQETRFQKKHQDRIILGSVLLMLGGILPWYGFYSPHFETRMVGGGFDYGGMYTGGVGLLILILVIVRRGRIGTVVPETTIILSLITLIVTLALFSRDYTDPFIRDYTPGLGLILSLLGALLLLWGSAGILSFQRK